MKLFGVLGRSATASCRLLCVYDTDFIAFSLVGGVTTSNGVLVPNSGLLFGWRDCWA